jgi:hypothetical protein
MSNLIPLHVVNLALEAKDTQIKQYDDENKRLHILVKEEQDRVKTLLNNNYRLRNAVMAALDMHTKGHTFTEDERLAMWNSIEGSLV